MIATACSDSIYALRYAKSRSSTTHVSSFEPTWRRRRFSAVTHSKPQHVLVTAAASGIGRATAEAFLVAGARVHVCDNDASALQEMELANFGTGRLTSTVADCSNESDVDQLFRQASVAFDDRFDVLVNGVGVAGPVAATEDITPIAWRQTVDANLTSTFLCSRLVIPRMKREKRGTIINIASTAGLLGCPRRTPYASAKWALIGFTKSLAIELGPYNIRTNAVCPTSVDGPRIERVIASAAQELGCTPDEVRSEWESQVSMRCFVTAEEVAGYIFFLAGEGGRHISGQALALDGHTETLA